MIKSKLSPLIALLFLSFHLNAQDNKPVKGSIGLTFTVTGNNDFINKAGKALIGGPSYDGKNFFTAGLCYVYPLLPWLDIESGIVYSSHTITVKPNLPSSIDNAPFDENITLIDVPVTARINFLKYFFVNGGLVLGIETGNPGSVESQTGIGTLMGIGAKYSLRNGIGAFVNGYYKFHAMLPLSAENDDYRWKLLEGGLRIGLTYSF